MESARAPATAEPIAPVADLSIRFRAALLDLLILSVLQALLGVSVQNVLTLWLAYFGGAAIAAVLVLMTVARVIDVKMLALIWPLLFILHVTYKAAMSLDGRTAAADRTSQWITGSCMRFWIIRIAPCRIWSASLKMIVKRTWSISKSCRIALVKSPRPCERPGNVAAIAKAATTTITQP